MKQATRTNIEIDDELMWRASGQTTKWATAEAALDLLVEIMGQERIRKAFGTLPWDDDLDAMRFDDEDPATGGKGR